MHTQMMKANMDVKLCVTFPSIFVPLKFGGTERSYGSASMACIWQ